MSKKPNVLFFVSDQHSSKFLGKNGVCWIDTPNLDRLAQEGVTFANTYCQNPLCVPSRASLLTGTYSKHVGLYENRHILQSNMETLPRVLSNHGYRTCLIGKSHFNGEQFQGYQQRPYGDLLGQAHQAEYVRKGGAGESEHGLEDLLENSGATSIPLPLTQTEIVVAESVKWLQRYADSSKESPFFLSVHFDKPHFPYRAPKALFDKYVGKVNLPKNNRYVTEEAVEFVRKAVEVNGGWEHYGTDEAMHLHALAAYSACVEWVDDAVGRILDSLQYLGLSDDTIIIYSSDHGEMAGEKGAWQKTVFFDESAKVPLIMRWKDSFKAHGDKADLVGLIDMFPTICDLAGIPIPKKCDGVSLLPLLMGEAQSLDRDHIFSESVVLKTPGHAGCMMRSLRYKYNYYLVGKHELYDMEADPGEYTNLVDRQDHTEIAAEMKAAIEQFWNPEEQVQRYEDCPIMHNEKHFYLYSNQFLSGDGAMFNGRP
ncbi:MAG: sulfatase-like hydrolase/transferase [Sphaerochaeta sp.]|nr:sulfatase-like hydrolase/transferase [Sphaerochaeta sp.]